MTTHTRNTLAAVVLGAAASAVLFLGAGIAQAVSDHHERATIVDHLSSSPSAGEFDPQPDPPANRNPGTRLSERAFDPQPDPPGISVADVGPNVAR
jgi:hypothetical protein